ncbi:hypothetical protein C0J52_08521 [Blattella germanica]|nr:hypothetical protein C0J52_08521 [Blattella germanica]
MTPPMLREDGPILNAVEAAGGDENAEVNPPVVQEVLEGVAEVAGIVAEPLEEVPLQGQYSSSSSSNDVAAGSGSQSSLPSSDSPSRSGSHGDSGVNSEATTTDVTEGLGGYYLIPIGPGRSSPSILPNPDITSITFCKPYVEYMESACEALIIACESSTLNSPRMVSSYRHLVGPCPHLSELCYCLSSVTFDLGTFCLRLLAGAYQLQRVIKHYKPTITKTEDCRKYMIICLSKFIQCLQVLSIECEDLFAYYTYFSTTKRGLKFEKGFHSAVLEQVNKNFLSVEKLIESLEGAQVMFENAFYKLDNVPKKCKNLGKLTMSGSTSSDSSLADDSLGACGGAPSGSKSQGLSFGAIKRGISSIGKKITDKIRKTE